MNLAHLLITMACSTGQIGNGNRADDGYTYRIGEVNPYNDNAWYRHYRGVQSGSRIDNLYNLVTAREAQRREDADYINGLRRRYDEGRARWDAMNQESQQDRREYNDEIREYNAAWAEYEGEASRRGLFATESDAEKDRRAELDKWRKKLDGWSDDIDDKYERLQELRGELNELVRQTDAYTRKAEENVRATQQLTNEYQTLKYQEAVRRRMNTRPRGGFRDRPGHAGMTPWG